MVHFKPNDGKHIHDIINRTVCDKHGAGQGEPCFKVQYDLPIDGREGRDLYGPAICGSRVLSAGFNGKISAASLSRMVKGR